MGWTKEENRRFEDALAVYGPEDPDRWQHVANAVGGKSAQEVRRHYEILMEDVNRIERDQVPLPRYTTNSRQTSRDASGMMRNLNLR